MENNCGECNSERSGCLKGESMGEPTYNFRRLMSLIERKARSHYTQALKPLGLTYAELPFFLTLTQKEGVSQDELAEWVGVDKALATRALRSLEEKGFIQRKVNEFDSRKRCVFLTAKGTQCVDEVLEITLELNRSISAGISANDMQAVYQALLQMADNLGASAAREFEAFDRKIFAAKAGADVGALPVSEDK